MLGGATLGEVPLAAIRAEDSDADPTLLSDLYPAPPADRVYLVELYPFQPSEAA